MKKFSLIITFLIFTLSGNSSLAQTSIYGDWIVSCLTERINKSSFNFCDICEIEKTSTSCITIKDFEVNISNEITISKGDKTETHKYIYYPENEILEFEFNGKNYKFQVINPNETGYLILKSEDGMLLFMKKKGYKF